ncbi:hypothetical protein CEXT_299761 [Caerostris extrusa]|uniref:Uncharacterized protein n=1 Tax=Caerostris extrusa TaxID=172846 RepID=A0AAV4V6V3_CAEEX|nr:hypothetical protein CEXT_299761 [Caerostris extrusa]
MFLPICGNPPRNFLSRSVADALCTGQWSGAIHRIGLMTPLFLSFSFSFPLDGSHPLDLPHPLNDTPLFDLFRKDPRSLLQVILEHFVTLHLIVYRKPLGSVHQRKEPDINQP